MLLGLHDIRKTCDVDIKIAINWRFIVQVLRSSSDLLGKNGTNTWRIGLDIDNELDKVKIRERVSQVD